MKNRTEIDFRAWIKRRPRIADGEKRPPVCSASSRTPQLAGAAPGAGTKSGKWIT
ncbi:MAG: hypothetical protein WKF30_17220 [Pyrinomonadaceae bacterium]